MAEEKIATVKYAETKKHYNLSELPDDKCLKNLEVPQNDIIGWENWHNYQNFDKDDGYQEILMFVNNPGCIHMGVVSTKYNCHLNMEGQNFGTMSVPISPSMGDLSFAHTDLNVQAKYHFRKMKKFGPATFDTSWETSWVGDPSHQTHSFPINPSEDQPSVIGDICWLDVDPGPWPWKITTILCTSAPNYNLKSNEYLATLHIENFDYSINCDFSQNDISSGAGLCYTGIDYSGEDCVHQLNQMNTTLEVGFRLNFLNQYKDKIIPATLEFKYTPKGETMPLWKTLNINIKVTQSQTISLPSFTQIIPQDGEILYVSLHLNAIKL